MADRLTLTDSTTDAGVRIELDGELDLTTVGDLSDAIGGHLADGTVIELDCGGLRFIDSTGLSSLVESHQRATDAGARLTLVEVPDHARRLMQITKIDELLDLA